MWEFTDKKRAKASTGGSYIPQLLVLQVAIDSATPVDDAGTSGNFMMDEVEPFAGYGGPIRPYGRMYGSLDFNDVSAKLEKSKSSPW